MATHTIPPDAAVARAPGLMSSDLDGETVLMSDVDGDRQHDFEPG